MTDLAVSFLDLSRMAGGLPARVEPRAIGGGIEGANALDRETALWQPSMRSPDAAINTVKDTADARGRDSVQNDGYVAGAASIHKDSIVGSQFRLNSQPNWRALAAVAGKGFDEAWADEFQQAVEARFGLLADSEACWLDASRRNTLTAMVRLAIAVFLSTGEVIGTAEWIREAGRPYNTAIQFVRSTRLCNPYGNADSRTLRRGVEKDSRGKPVSYWFRRGERFDTYPDNFAWDWTNVPARKPWGRLQVIHIAEQQDYDQTRGVSAMVSVLKNIRMTKRFREIVLQSAVINATYAAAIESELPSEAIAAALGQGTNAGEGLLGVYGAYMNALAKYLGGANNIAVDGATVPHLFPGTKMRLQNAGTPGGIGTNFEESLLRHTAAALDVSYESLSRDFSKTNYSSGRLAMNVQGQAMASRKKGVADRFASEIFALVLEEMIAAGDVPLPAGVRRDVFYLPLMKEAFCKCNWIGSGAGQVDELKETQAAILRIRSGITTHEIEGSRLGYDWREIAEQRAREQREFAAKGLAVNYDASKPTVKPSDTQSDDPANETTGGNESQQDNGEGGQ